MNPAVGKRASAVSGPADRNSHDKVSHRDKGRRAAIKDANIFHEQCHA